MLRHPLSFLGGFAVGALVMYYLDEQSGGRRRALARDKMVAAGHDAAWTAQAKGKRAVDRAKGVMATGHLDRVSRHEPDTAQQLHDRIRSRLGRVVSHPRSVHVAIEPDCVCLTGHVLRKEVDHLLAEVQGIAGVDEVRNELQVHETAEGISELQGRTEPPGREQRETEKTPH